MSHWSEKYVGQPYIKGEFICGDLVRLVMKEQCRFDVQAPTNRHLNESDLIAFADEYADQLELSDVLQDFDAVLMHQLGAKTVNRWHIGVVAMINLLPWVLHNIVGQGVIFQPSSQLNRVGLEIEGFYRWRM